MGVSCVVPVHRQTIGGPFTLSVSFLFSHGAIMYMGVRKRGLNSMGFLCSYCVRVCVSIGMTKETANLRAINCFLSLCTTLCLKRQATQVWAAAVDHLAPPEESQRQYCSMGRASPIQESIECIHKITPLARRTYVLLTIPVQLVAASRCGSMGWLPRQFLSLPLAILILHQVAHE